MKSTALLLTPTLATLSLASALTETKQPWTQGCHPHSCLPSTKAWNSPTTDFAPWTSYSSYLPRKSSYPTSHHHYTGEKRDAQLVVPTGMVDDPCEGAEDWCDPFLPTSTPTPTTFQTRTHHCRDAPCPTTKTSSTWFECPDDARCMSQPTTTRCSSTTTHSVHKDPCDDGSCLFTSTYTHIDLATMTVPHGYEGPCGPDGQWSCWFPYEPECTGYYPHCKATVADSTILAVATSS